MVQPPKCAWVWYPPTPPHTQLYIWTLGQFNPILNSSPTRGEYRSSAQAYFFYYFQRSERWCACNGFKYALKTIYRRLLPMVADWYDRLSLTNSGCHLLSPITIAKYHWLLEFISNRFFRYFFFLKRVRSTKQQTIGDCRQWWSQVVSDKHPQMPINGRNQNFVPNTRQIARCGALSAAICHMAQALPVSVLPKASL